MIKKVLFWVLMVSLVFTSIASCFAGERLETLEDTLQIPVKSHIFHLILFIIVLSITVYKFFIKTIWGQKIKAKITEIAKRLTLKEWVEFIISIICLGLIIFGFIKLGTLDTSKQEILAERVFEWLWDLSGRIMFAFFVMVGMLTMAAFFSSVMSGFCPDEKTEAKNKG